MERTATNALAALAAIAIVIATWAPVVTVPAAEATTVVAPALA
jgi:hypothetical protein